MILFKLLVLTLFVTFCEKYNFHNVIFFLMPKKRITVLLFLNECKEFLVRKKPSLHTGHDVFTFCVYLMHNVMHYQTFMEGNNNHDQLQLYREQTIIIQITRADNNIYSVEQVPPLCALLCLSSSFSVQPSFPHSHPLHPCFLQVQACAAEITVSITGLKLPGPLCSSAHHW